LLHRLAHLLHWQLGHVVSAFDKHGTLWMAFKCQRCGKVTGIHASHRDAPSVETFHQ
jgi:hypothetical protein